MVKPKVITLKFTKFISILIFCLTFNLSENEKRNETTSDLPKPHIVIIGETG
jgi:hypothetical protein